MRNSWLFIFIAFSVIAFAQKKNQLPPGTVKLEENLFLNKQKFQILHGMNTVTGLELSMAKILKNNWQAL